MMCRQIQCIALARLCKSLQVTVDYVALTPQGKVFDSSLEKGRPYDVRIGSGQV